MVILPVSKLRFNGRCLERRPRAEVDFVIDLPISHQKEAESVEKIREGLLCDSPHVVGFGVVVDITNASGVTVSEILEPKNSFMVLNLYSNGFSAALGETVVKQAFGLDPDGKGYKMESGELALRDRFGKVLPLSIVIRLER